ncbi:hypothetical protein Csa_023704, partial [Cucumis sativus]
YVSKWNEAIFYAKNDAVTVIKFLKRNIFTQFGTPRALISNEGFQFINHIMANLLVKYNITHKITTIYDP